MAGLSYFGLPPPHCNWARPTTSMVPPTRSPCFLSTNYTPDQPFTRNFYHSVTMKASIHPTCTKSRRSQKSLRLPAHVNNLCSHSCHGEDSIRLSGIHHHPTKSVTRRPICLPPKKFHYSCTHSPLSHCHTHAHNKSTRHCLCLCLDFSNALDTVRHSTLLAKRA